MYCHPSYHDSLKLEFMDVEVERKKTALVNRNAYAKSYRQKAKARNQESKALTEKQGWAKFLGV